MRYQGKISGWKDQRGFGFITPNGGGERVFVHISAFDKGQQRPGDGALVTYELFKDDKKGYRAQNVTFVACPAAGKTGDSGGKMRTVISLLLLLGLAIAGWQHFPTQLAPSRDSSFSGHDAPEITASQSGDQALANAFQNHRSNLQIEGQGTVSKILPDDLDGSRHQRFLIRLGSGQTLLVAHNIDLAPRIDSLKKGDSVEFYGEYEWNAKGGVIHWTHHDPAGRHADGWIRHGGQTYR